MGGGAGGEGGTGCIFWVGTELGIIVLSFKLSLSLLGCVYVLCHLVNLGAEIKDCKFEALLDYIKNSMVKPRLFFAKLL